jgi:hypothetical protein
MIPRGPKANAVSPCNSTDPDSTILPEEKTRGEGMIDFRMQWKTEDTDEARAPLQ